MITVLFGFLLEYKVTDLNGLRQMFTYFDSCILTQISKDYDRIQQ